MKPNVHMRGEQIVEALASHGGCYYDGYGGVILYPNMYGSGFAEFLREELQKCAITSIRTNAESESALRLHIEVLVHTDADLKSLVELLHKYRKLAAVTHVLKGL